MKRGCDLFDEQALAKALGTTEPITESPDKSGGNCAINAGPTAQVSAMVDAAADNERTGFAAWRQTVGNVVGARDLSLASGDKAFVAADPAPHRSNAGVLHEGTFYRISVMAMKDDPVKVATAFVDVLEAGLSGS